MTARGREPPARAPVTREPSSWRVSLCGMSWPRCQRESMHDRPELREDQAHERFAKPRRHARCRESLRACSRLGNLAGSMVTRLPPALPALHTSREKARLDRLVSVPTPAVGASATIPSQSPRIVCRNSGYAALSGPRSPRHSDLPSATAVLPRKTHTSGAAGVADHGEVLDIPRPRSSSAAVCGSSPPCAATPAPIVLSSSGGARMPGAAGPGKGAGAPGALPVFARGGIVELCQEEAP